MTAAPVIELEIRPPTPEEAGFIAETTAKVLRPRDATWASYGPAAMPLIAEAIAKGGALVAASDGVVLGFLLAPAGVLEMLYVKRDFRGNGIGLRLLWASGLGDPVTVRQETASWRAWARSKALEWRRAGHDGARV